MANIIHVIDKDLEFLVDMIEWRMGESDTQKVIDHIKSHHRTLDKEHFVLLMSHGAFPRYENIRGNEKFASAMFEYLTRNAGKHAYVEISSFLDEIGQEVVFGESLDEIIDNMGYDGAALPEIASSLFKGGIYQASNGLWLCFQRKPINVSYI
jgi:hypothetical protein